MESIRLLPAREFPLRKEAVTGFRGRFRERFDVDYRRCPIYQDLASGLTPAGIEYYIPLFFEDGETSTLFDYLPQDTQVFSLPGIETAAEQFWTDVRNRYEDRRYDPERPLLPPAEVFLPVEDCFARLKNWPRVVVSPEPIETGVGRERFPAEPLPELAIEAKATEPLARLRQFIEQFDGRILFTAESAGRREVLLELLARLKLRPVEVEGWPGFLAHKDRLAITIAPMDEGLLLDAGIGQPGIALVAESPLFGQRVMQRRRREKTRDGGENVIKNLTELREGAPVVHIDHGVGRYMGLITLEIDGQNAEFLALQYADEAKLYVPVANLHLIARYTGSDDALAPLHKLGSETWQKAKRKAAEQVRDVAAELLDIYARRAARKATPSRTRRSTTPPSPPASPSRKPRTSRPPSKRWSPTCSRKSRWTAWSAATWASARPKWPCARPSSRCTAASRSPCWCPPPSSPNSTTTASATVSPTGR